MSNLESASVADTGNEFVDLEGDSSLNKEKTIEKNKRQKRSHVWNHFEVLDTGTNGFKICKCKHCGHKYNKISSKTGTGNLKRHIESCPRRNTHDVGEMMISKSSGPKFDAEYFRELLCSAVIFHDLPFRFIEYERIIACFEYLRPDIKLVSRNTLKADVLKLYAREKMRIKSMLKETPGRISLTSDCWSSITTDGYISLTCHFIDKEWVLQKRVLNFSLMPSPHTGATLSNKLISMISEWGIESKLFALTLDNASANDLSVDLLLTQLNLNNALVCNGDYFHIRCCAHIMNLVVQDGLKDIDGAITKIRESIKYVRGSQMRKQKFLECVGMVSLSSKKGLRQDVPTRWNSTFLMLDSALYYRKAFLNLQLSDHNYKNCPSLAEWEKVEKICSFLGLFYEVSNMFCGSKYPTANLYFRPIVTCYASLRQSRDVADEYIKKMASQMLSKFEKYWHNFSLILTIAVVFDPRYKLQFVEFSYNKLYGPNSHQYVQVKEKLFDIFHEYRKMFPSQEGNNTTNMMDVPHSSSSYENEMAIAMVEEFNAFDTEFGLSQQKSQLELYLEEPRMDVKVNLDILEYWKGNQYRYPLVASIARDILCIPITTVASESIFSVGGRVLDQYRSALKPNNVEAIICTRDWLYGDKVAGSELRINELVENLMDIADSDAPTECSTLTLVT